MPPIYQRQYRKLHEVAEAPGEYYQLIEPVTPDEILEMARLIAADKLKPGVALTSPQASKQALATLLQDIEREVFGCVFLDNQHQIRKFDILFTGTVDSASVYPREVVKRALAYNATAVIFTHNHPSGIAEPSQADRRITRRLTDALALIDVRVLDHFVIGHGEIVSFAERGWI